MPITPLPTPPSRQDPANFATRADEFLGALPAFATQANALEAEYEAAAAAAANAVLTSKLNNTDPSYTGTLTGGTGVIDIGSGQIYKDSSGNVGIGTASPGYRVDVLGYGRFSSGIIGDGGLTLYGDTSSGSGVLLSTSGNFGLGVTPSAWRSTHRVIEGGRIGNALAFSTVGSAVELLSNAYINSSNQYAYANNGFASDYYQMDGAHSWYTAPSGTAGNPISFTQAMALTSSSELQLDSGTSGGRLTLQPGNTANSILSTTTGFGAYNILRYYGTQHQWFNPSAQAMTLSAGGRLTVPIDIWTGQLNFNNGGTADIINRSAAGLDFYVNSGSLKAASLDTSGNLLVGTGTGSYHIISKNGGNSAGTTVILEVQNAGSDAVAQFMSASAFATASSAGTGIRVGRSLTTSRSINAGGTINASGADYAEYEHNNGLTIAKGSIVGFKADGTLTLTYSEAIRCAVKSTDPSYVGGDVWGSGEQVGKRPEKPTFTAPAYTGPATPGEEPTAPADDADEATVDAYAQAHAVWNEAFAAHHDAMAEHAGAVASAQAEFDDVTWPAYEAELAAFEARLEAARQLVDRIAYSGKVPCNVMGATPGDYIVATAAADGSITGIPVAEPDFAQYRKAVGRVNRLLPDGRCEVAVIIH